MPNRPQTRMRLTVFGEKPRYGSTNGAAIRPDGRQDFDEEEGVA